MTPPRIRPTTEQPDMQALMDARADALMAVRDAEQAAAMRAFRPSPGYVPPREVSEADMHPLTQHASGNAGTVLAVALRHLEFNAGTSITTLPGRLAEDARISETTMLRALETITSTPKLKGNMARFSGSGLSAHWILVGLILSAAATTE
ncbi:hypothetical protein [Deinococcus sp.]|uniref:hypothetical protein n=1 Tax=Deinococcus sp. TaxID=47478 RepID=UPI003CC505B5